MEFFLIFNTYAKNLKDVHMLSLFTFSFTPSIPIVINPTNKGLREVTNQANGKDSIMTSYYVWIGTISDVVIFTVIWVVASITLSSNSNNINLSIFSSL